MMTLFGAVPTQSFTGAVAERVILVGYESQYHAASPCRGAWSVQVCITAAFQPENHPEQ